MIEGVGVGCAECGARNPQGQRFCGMCGASLQRSCPACGTGATLEQRFCGSCGTALEARLADGGDAASSPAPVAQRRVVTVLFADLVGFTALSEQRDPEAVRELLSTYFTSARTVIDRYGGTVEKFIGDAVMAVWGTPVAHEDDAERAVRAALDLVSAVRVLADEQRAPELSIRLGVVTGEVAVTIGAVGEGMVAGDAVNTAARVQALASPSSVLVDQATRALTAAAISYRDAGIHELKGKSERVQLYSAGTVVASVRGSQRVDGLEAPFTGRDRELRLIKEMFHASVEEGRPQLVSVTGVAGVGKSRLGWEFEKYSDGVRDVISWHRGRVLSYGDGVTFWALAEMVRFRLGIADSDPAGVAMQRLDVGLEEFVADIAERAWLRPRLTALVGFGAADDAAEFTGEELFAAWSAFFQRVAETGDAIVLMFEDMHSAEPGLFDFLDYLLEAARFPVFVLTLGRPELAEVRPTWGTGRHATSVYLDPLPEPAMAQIVDDLVAGLPDSLRDQLVQRSEGIPLYAVETVRSLIDHDAVLPQDGRYVLAPDHLGRVDLTDLAAPASLQALVAARLDALTPRERQIVADASVHGLVFSRESFAATLDDDSDLDNVLGSLVRKEIFAVQNDRFSQERGQFRFVQALLRKVAYETLSRRDRKSRHLAVARQIAASPGAEGELSSLLARHYLDALDNGPDDDDAIALTERAVQLLERAGQHAASLGASDEALRHFRTGSERARDTATRARLQLAAARMAQSCGRFEDCRELAVKARAEFDELGQPLESARCRVTEADAVSRQDLHGAVSLLEPLFDEVAQMPDSTSVQLDVADLLARSYAQMGQEQDTRGREWASTALRLAEYLGQPAGLAAALTRMGVSSMLSRMPTSGLAMVRQADEVAREAGLRASRILPLNNLAAFMLSRDPAAALRAGSLGLEICEQVGRREFITRLVVNAQAAAWLTGDWALVAELGERYPAGSDDRMDWPYQQAVQLLAEMAAGRPTTLQERPLEDVDNTYARAAVKFYETVWALHRDDAPAAVAPAVEGLRATFEYGGVDDDFGLMLGPAADALLAAGRVDEVEDILRRIAGFPPGILPALVRAQHTRIAALVVARRGVRLADEVSPEQGLADAAERFRALGVPFYLGRALLERAELLAASGPEEARASLAEAAATFRSLGAAPWLAQVEAVERRVARADQDLAL